MIVRQAAKFGAHPNEQSAIRIRSVKAQPEVARSAPYEALLAGLPVISPDLAVVWVAVRVA
jgi:hypothetical protein